MTMIVMIVVPGVVIPARITVILTITGVRHTIRIGRGLVLAGE